jgi:hypothetical protein
MAISEFHVAISDKKNSALREGMAWVRVTLDPSELRGEEVQKKYEAYMNSGGSKITAGWRVNRFPYSVVLAEMAKAGQGQEWVHLVHAQDSRGYRLDNMLSWLKYVGVEDWLAFINPPKMQSQPHIPHGHAIVPKVHEQAILNCTYRAKEGKHAR